jgi:hypothetical protein
MPACAPEPQAPQPSLAAALTDALPPLLKLSNAKTQDIDRLVVTGTIDEASTLAVKATVSVPGNASRVYLFKRVTRKVAAGSTFRLRLRLRDRARKVVKRALAKGKKLRALIYVTATDSAGNRRNQKHRIRLMD